MEISITTPPNKKTGFVSVFTNITDTMTHPVVSVLENCEFIKLIID
jgi:hypothetical protein